MPAGLAVSNAAVDVSTAKGPFNVMKFNKLYWHQPAASGSDSEPEERKVADFYFLFCYLLPSVGALLFTHSTTQFFVGVYKPPGSKRMPC